MINRFLFYYLLCICFQISAQKEIASKHIANLSSNEMYGRGYVKEGHNIAANYISKEFCNYGLKPYNENGFFQGFNINVNTFPNKIQVSLNNKILETGKDFILEPQSGSAYGSYDLYRFDPNLSIEKQLDLPVKTVVVLDVSKVKNIDSISVFEELKHEIAKVFPVIMLTKNKFTWSVSSFAFPNPVIQMRPSDLKNKQKIQLNISNKFINDLSTQNVIGEIKGRKDKYVVFSAHYDHLGMMGDVIFPGANDNASGAAMLLSLANYYAKKKPKYSMMFIGFAAEEVGLKGSSYFVNNPSIDLNKIQLVINLDIVGTGSEGIAIVNAKEQENSVKKLIRINNKNKFFSKVKIRGQAPNSDHYWFSQKEVPAIFIYTMGGIKAYHDIYDIHQTLPLDNFKELYSLLVSFVKKI
ncbi:MAG: aminopeptidase [Crocinitomicaceae bacterium]|nr:aminopeptidase [Crocinitomicaceae bacterium]|tara:strand:- start:8014 stop:9246 length:1233 start_codon:yes stop_codon:yes gene_type:complete